METINRINGMHVSELKNTEWEKLKDFYSEPKLIKEVYDIYEDIDKLVILSNAPSDKNMLFNTYKKTRDALEAFHKINIRFFSIYADKHLLFPSKEIALEYLQSSNIHINKLQNTLSNLSYCIQRIENDESMNKANESLTYAKIYFIASCILSIISIIVTVFNLTINSLSQ